VSIHLGHAIEGQRALDEEVPQVFSVDRVLDWVLVEGIEGVSVSINDVDGIILVSGLKQFLELLLSHMLLVRIT